MTDTLIPVDSVMNPAGYFPGVFINKVEESLNRYLPEIKTQARPVRTEDSGNTIGIYSASWTPDEDTYEIGNGYAPTCSYYMIKIQNVTKALNETTGRAEFSNIAKMIRVILVRDPDLRVALLGLQEEMLSTKERVTRFKVMRQDYLSSRLGQTFLYLATTDLLIETETTFLPELTGDEMTDTTTQETPVETPEAPAEDKLSAEEVRSQVDQLREQIQEEKNTIARQEAEANTNFAFDQQAAERDRLRAELASLRGVSVDEVELPTPIEPEPTPGFSTLEEINAANEAAAAAEKDAASGVTVTPGEQVPAEQVPAAPVPEVPEAGGGGGDATVVVATEAPESTTTRRTRG